jgi:hypothetical protein
MLGMWFWKDGTAEVGALDVWQKTNCYLYLPRLKSDNVFRTAIAAGAASTDFFGLAYAKEEDKYIGFSFGQATTPILDSTLLLIEPTAATAYAEVERVAKEAAKPKAGEYTTGPVPSGDVKGVKETGEVGAPVPPKPSKRRFYGSLELDPIQAKRQFSDIVDEVVLHFTSRPGAKVRVAIDIEANDASGFDDALQRAVKENCKVLKFKNAEFEGGE